MDSVQDADITEAYCAEIQANIFEAIYSACLAWNWNDEKAECKEQDLKDDVPRAASSIPLIHVNLQANASTTGAPALKKHRFAFASASSSHSGVSSAHVAVNKIVTLQEITAAQFSEVHWYCRARITHANKYHIDRGDTQVKQYLEITDTTGKIPIKVFVAKPHIDIDCTLSREGELCTKFQPDIGDLVTVHRHLETATTLSEVILASPPW